MPNHPDIRSRERVVSGGRPGAHRIWPSTVAWLVYSAILGGLYARLPPNPDQSIFDYIAWVCAEGGVPYRDAGDENFPGAIALHTLARLAFGAAPWAFRAFDYLALVGFCLAARVALIRRGERALADCFVPLYQAMYITSGSWFAGQRDIIAAHLGLLAGFALLRRLEGGGAVWLVGLGAGSWAAALVKPTFAACLPALALVDLALRGRSRRGLARVATDQALALLAAGCLTCLLAAWARWAGALGAWYEMAILLNVEYYAGQSPGRAFVLRALAWTLWTSWRWYAVAAAAGGFAWWRSGDRPSLLVALAILGVTILSALAQGKGFGYHFGGVLPVLGLLSAATLARLAATAFAPSFPPRARLAGAAALAFAALVIASKIDHEYRRQVEWRVGRITIADYLGDYQLRAPAEVAAFVGERTAPEDTVLVYSNNYDMIINLLANRRSPVRFIPSMLIDMGAPPFSRAGPWLDEWDQALRHRAPRFIVMVEPIAGPGSNPPEPSPGRKSLDATIAARYRCALTAETPGTLRYLCFERTR